MRSLLSDNKQSFEACAEFFGSGKGAQSVSPDDKPDETETSDPEQKRAVYTSAQFLADKYKDYPISEDILKLSDAGVEKISLSGSEVRFYTSIDSGLCYIPGDSSDYYPEGYLDDNRIEGREPVVTMDRYQKGYGASYNCHDANGVIPVVDLEGRLFEIPTAWLCPVTLLVLFRYPKRINLYIPENETK